MGMWTNHLQRKAARRYLAVTPDPHVAKRAAAEKARGEARAARKLAEARAAYAETAAGRLNAAKMEALKAAQAAIRLGDFDAYSAIMAGYNLLMEMSPEEYAQASD